MLSRLGSRDVPPSLHCNGASGGEQRVAPALRLSSLAAACLSATGASLAVGTTTSLPRHLACRSRRHGRLCRDRNRHCMRAPQVEVTPAAIEDDDSPKVRVKRRPPRVTMSKRTPLEERPCVEYLEKCLASGRLEEADQVTRDMILMLAGTSALARGFALASEVKAIAPESLRSIDGLWLKYSEGNLGYSVQHRIWTEVGRDVDELVRQVGWLIHDPSTGKELRRFWPRREFDYTFAAPTGHLPLTNMIRGKDLLVALIAHPAWEEGDLAHSAPTSTASQGSAPSMQLPSAGEEWWAEITGAGDSTEPSNSPSLDKDIAAFDGYRPRKDLAGAAVDGGPSPAQIVVEQELEAEPGTNLFEDAMVAARDWFQGEHDDSQAEKCSEKALPTKSPLEPSVEDEEGLDFDFKVRGAAPIFRITLIAGFETFNARLYAEAAERAIRRCPGMQVCVFTDKDLDSRRGLVAQALRDTDVVFCSLIFDYDQAEWLKEQLAAVPVRFVFESALELMSNTRVGAFAMSGGPSGGNKGMPPQVKAILSKLTGTREEDRIAGYTKFLKLGPKLLKFLPPIGPLPDLRRWLQTYAYWSGGGAGNVAKMLRYIAREFGGFRVDFDDLLSPDGSEETSAGPLTEPEVVEVPQVGLLHPSRKFPNEPGPFFSTPKDYMEWFRTYKPEALEENWPVCAILLFRKHVISELAYIPQLINYFEEKKLLPLPLFIQGVDAHIAVRDLLTSREEQEAVQMGIQPPNPTMSPNAVEVDCVVNTIGFPLVGGPAGSMEGGRSAEVAKEILSSLNVPYVVSAPLLIQDVASWRDQGIGGLQGVVLYALPELDGAVDTVPLGGLLKKSGDIELLPDRAARLTQRLQSWVELRRKPKAERRVAIILYGYPPGLGAAGTAALLNVPRSLRKLLLQMKEHGYDVNDVPDDPEHLVRMVREADLLADSGQAYRNDVEAQLGAANVSAETLGEWLPRWSQESIERSWGGLTKSSLRTIGNELLLGGRQFGNVWIAVQPPLGIPGDPMRLLFERDMTPHPQYVAFYKFLEKEFRADAVVHFGMHGTAEWLPGRPLGNMASCWPDQLLGSLPNIYLYAANNPSESLLAKRRGYASIISHNVPPYARAGLYRELQTLRGLLTELMEEEAPPSPSVPDINSVSGAPSLEGAILQAVLAAGLEEDVPLPAAALTELRSQDHADDEARAEAMATAMRCADGDSTFLAYAGRLRAYLAELEASLFSSGLHTLGEGPDESDLRSYLTAYFDGEERPAIPEEALDLICHGAASHECVAKCHSEGEVASAHEALSLRDLLSRNKDELENMLRALNGEFILPSPGGDLLRDGAGVLPTGRNIHALDPYRIPSKQALARGIAIAEAAIEDHRQEMGDYPETIAVNLWGLEAIKTRGESVAVVLGLVGARPVEEATGRVVRFQLLPLEELGRPRVDALCSLSGIFRDSFANVVELLDDVLAKAAKADEPSDMNFVRKHFMAMRDREGEDGAASRIFSNAAGEFGSLVNERISAGTWDKTGELGETWAQRNAFAFGRSQRGVQRRSVLDALLSSSGSVVQLTDSVEYGLTDIQEYYANTGAMVRKMSDLQGRKVDALVVETTQKKVRPRKLTSALRLEYRTKFLNPKWAEAMVAQGSGGAFEVSQRITALLGWGATTAFKEDWVWNQSVQQYVLNQDIAKKLEESNPEAFRNIVGRCLEASARELWNADEDVLQKLRDKYDALDDELEGIV